MTTAGPVFTHREPTLPETMQGRGDTAQEAKEDLVAQCKKRLAELDRFDRLKIGLPWYVAQAQREMKKFVSSRV